MPERNPSTKLLLIEDDRDHAEILMRIISQESKNFEVDWLSDGQLALDFLFGERQAAQHESPNAIVLDLKLPKVGGLEVLKKIREHHEMDNIPVFILSTSDHPGDIERAQALGIKDYLIKSFSLESYKGTVRKLLKNWELN